MGQAPDRQASLGAGIPKSVPTTLVNKVGRTTWPPGHLATWLPEHMIT